jgi:tetratricopeptide (TPR) repeat protein
MESARRVAALAFAQGRHDQAVQLYGRALELAQARDDGMALGDLGHDLAVVQLRRGDAVASLAAITAARAELLRHGLPAFPELALVEAVSLYRLGRVRDAEALAIELAIDGTATGRRARFLLGLVAAERGDLAGLASARAGLVHHPDPEWRADDTELAARAAALGGDHLAARAAFAETADLRRETRDYPGMARALAAAAASAQAMGDRDAAAALYLRAGRSMVLSGGGAARAEAWLVAAERLATESANRAVLSDIAALRARRD